MAHTENNNPYSDRPAGRGGRPQQEGGPIYVFPLPLSDACYSGVLRGYWVDKLSFSALGWRDVVVLCGDGCGNGITARRFLWKHFFHSELAMIAA